jgi:hypothetical protein
MATRLPTSVGIDIEAPMQAPPTEFNPGAPEFAPIRADLARLFILHKAELGMTEWRDEAIVAETNKIMSALMTATTHALAHNDQAWLERHRWFSEALERLFADQPAVKLDG